jgi:hypothetical protein
MYETRHTLKLEENMLTHQVWGVVSSNFLSLIDNLGLGSSTQSPLQGLNILSI